MSEEQGIEETQPAVTETAETDGVNYHDRIRSEPDFAVTEVQGKDRYIGELHEKALPYKPLEQYVSAVGGDEIARLANVGSEIERSPHRQAIIDIMNGVTQAAAPEPEPEIYDPEIKAMNDKFSPEILALQQANTDLTNRLNKSEAMGLTTVLTENMETALTTFKDNPALMEEAQAEITRAVGSLEKAAASGDRSAASQLENLAGTQGAKTLRMMTIDIYDKYVAHKLEGATNQPNGEAILGKATDARTITRSALPVDSVVVKTGGRITSNTVADVMAKVARKMGKDSNALFG